jgi:hypothetical protein
MDHRFRKLTPKEKALRINLDQSIYGTFAEIGAGQETAAMFFKAGGASGTIAKTMSAYDMAFSDAIYGAEPSGRYVCLPRVEKMIRREYGLLPERLPTRIKDTKFFAFANTVEALNYRRTNEGKGWIGVRFQTFPDTEPNECVIHVRLRDNDPLQQQQTLGIVGVNLIYGCLFQYEEPEEMLNSIVDDVTTMRVEINYFKLSGPDFKDVDPRLFSLKLVTNGLAEATMFDSDGEVLLPSDSLYKKNILILRGRFRPPTHVNVNMMEAGYQQFIKDPEVKENNVVKLAELTVKDLRAVNEDGKIDEKDFLDRAAILGKLGYKVMISNYYRYYTLMDYLAKFTRKKKIGIILGIYNLLNTFEEHHYESLKGGILQAFGSLFGSNVKFLVFPSYKRGTQDIITSQNLEIDEHLMNIYKYLQSTHKVEDIEGIDLSKLNIISDIVLEKIKSGESGWESSVPDTVAQTIKESNLFGYPEQQEG